MLGQGPGASWLFWALFIKFLRPKSLNEKPKSNDSCLAQTDLGSWLSEYFGLGKQLTHLCLNFPVWQINIIKCKQLGAHSIKIWLHKIRCRSNTSVCYKTVTLSPPFSCYLSLKEIRSHGHPLAVCWASRALLSPCPEAPQSWWSVTRHIHHN